MSKIITKFNMKDYQYKNVKLKLDNVTCCFYQPKESGIGKCMVEMNICDVYEETNYEKCYTKKIYNKYIKKIKSTLDFLLENYYFANPDDMTDDAQDMRNILLKNINVVT